MSDSICPAVESILLLKACLLDSQIDNPKGYIIVMGGKSFLLSEIFAKNPELKRSLIEERAQVYRLLGWEVPDAAHE
jgi:hypothetical protein